MTIWIWASDVAIVDALIDVFEVVLVALLGFCLVLVDCGHVVELCMGEHVIADKFDFVLLWTVSQKITVV